MLVLDSSHEGQYHIYGWMLTDTCRWSPKLSQFKQINTIGHIVTRSNLVVTWKDVSFCKVDVSNLVLILIIYVDLSGLWLDVSPMINTKKTCVYNKIGLRAQNMITTLDSIVNIILWTYVIIQRA
jgi:hypothetical protein